MQLKIIEIQFQDEFEFKNLGNTKSGMQSSLAFMQIVECNVPQGRKNPAKKNKPLISTEVLFTSAFFTLFYHCNNVGAVC